MKISIKTISFLISFGVITNTFSQKGTLDWAFFNNKTAGVILDIDTSITVEGTENNNYFLEEDKVTTEEITMLLNPRKDVSKFIDTFFTLKEKKINYLAIF